MGSAVSAVGSSESLGGDGVLVRISIYLNIYTNRAPGIAGTLSLRHLCSPDIAQ